MVVTNNEYTIYVDGSTYYAKDLITGDTLSNASFSSLLTTLNGTNLAAAGGRLQFRPGTYDISSATTTITHPIDFIGSGRGRTILRRTAGQNATTLQFNTPNVTIANLTIDGNYPNQDINQFAELAFGAGAGNILVYDVEIKNAKTRGINNSNNGAGQVTISECFIGSSTSSLAAPFFSGASTITKIRNCSLTNNPGGGPFCGGTSIISNCILSNNTGTAAGGDIAATTTATYLGVFDCIIGPGPGTTTDSGIEFGPTNSPSEFVAVGNMIFNKSGAGITSDPLTTSPITVVGNVIYNMGGSGIRMQGTNQKHVLIAENFCFNNQSYGIEISASGGAPFAIDNYTVRDNMCYGNVAGQWLDMGTGTHKKIENNILA